MYFTIQLLRLILRLAPSGIVRRFVPDETVLRSDGTRPPVARNDLFTSSEPFKQRSGGSQPEVSDRAHYA
ncbi:MAG: hypothetical protein ACREYE_26015 [Gammaproteobacteria bacterium]